MKLTELLHLSELEFAQYRYALGEFCLSASNSSRTDLIPNGLDIQRPHDQEQARLWSQSTGTPKLSAADQLLGRLGG